MVKTRRPVFYTIKKSEFLFEEMNRIGLKLKNMRDMVTSDRRISKREWEEFILNSAESQKMIKDWTKCVAVLKETINDQRIKPNKEEIESDDI